MEDIIIFPNDGYETLLLPEGFSYLNNITKIRPFHEPLFRRIVNILIQEQVITGNIIDLGAWIGDNSCIWANNIAPRKVYAIDPSTENCKYINKIKEVNLLDNLEVIEKAISNRVEIISTSDDLFHATFNQSIDGKNKVSAVSLDYLHENSIIKNIDFIHLDVEGMEYQVIQGADNIINKYRPLIIYEVHLNTDKHVDDIKNHLKSKDYDVYIINEILPGNHYDCRNCIAIPKEKNQSIINKIMDKLNGNYRLLLHIGNRVTDTIIDNLPNAMKLFTLFKGGDYACVLVENDNKLLKKYGMDQYCDQCYDYCLKNISKIDNLFTLQ